MQLQGGFDTVIVVEGCDGAGKSTLVKYLVEKHGLKLGERGVTDRDFLYKVTRNDTYRALAECVKGTPPHIWDRLFVSEFVYADIVGRPVEFNAYERDFVVQVMNALEFPMIVCLPPWETVEVNAQTFHQMKGVHANLRKIYHQYKEGILPWPEGTMWYDYTGATEGFAMLEDIDEEIGDYLFNRKRRESWI